MTDASVVQDPPDNAPAGDAFYTPPPLAAAGQHGDPIYQRPLDNPTAALRDGDNWLVLYRSEDIRGNPIGTSGIIALPKTAPPAGRIPGYQLGSRDGGRRRSVRAVRRCSTPSCARDTR
jgi:hypothetical protein